MLATIQHQPVPLPDIGVHIRAGTLDDVAFIDALQKPNVKNVGWMPTKALHGKIALGHVLVAEMRGERVGYLIGNDQYFKRDDLGVIYQVNVSPGKQRGLIGASLLRAQFDRSAWGCKLYCCWCAQDIAANKFWEAMGFVPLAFRTGSEKKQRMHIFWQKRIREGDTTTAWWFPSKTAGGSMREDRIVLPIPPGTHWSDAKPMVLPGDETASLALEGGGAQPPRPPRERCSKAKTKTAAGDSRPPGAMKDKTRSLAMSGGLHFSVPVVEAPVVAPPTIEKPKREKKPKQKNNPALVAAARELRDRWLEEVNSGRYQPTAEAKYEVSRAIDQQRAEGTPSMLTISAVKMLAA